MPLVIEIAALLPPAERSRAFSLRYTLANVGYATGPLLASLVAATQAALAFWLAAALVLACLPLLRGLPTGRLAAASAAPAPDFAATLHLLRRDRTLILFTIGSLLACVVQARFSDYLALYLLQTHSDAEVLRWMSVLITTNSLTVVLLQYPLGKLLRPHTLLRWIMASSLLLAAGLAGCALSDSLWAWAGWMVVFTLGEILLVPAEYLYIDAIAPEHLRGSYYGAQNLAQAGGAISPVLAGMVLLARPMQGVLTLTIVTGAYFVAEGIATIMYALEHRRELSGRWSWLLIAGLMDILVAFFIIAGLPESAGWAIGLLVGLNLMFGGATLIGMALAARNT